MEPQLASLRQSFRTWRIGDETVRAGLVAAARERFAALVTEEALDMVAMQFLQQLSSDRMTMSCAWDWSHPPRRTRTRRSC